MRVIDGHFLCANCIRSVYNVFDLASFHDSAEWHRVCRRPVDCVIRGQFSPELATNFICRRTGLGYVDGFAPVCTVGHMAKYCALGKAGCPWCVEPGSNCSACALATARPFVNIAAVNTVFKISNAEGRKTFVRNGKVCKSSFSSAADGRPTDKPSVFPEGKTRRKELRIQRERLITTSSESNASNSPTLDAAAPQSQQQPEPPKFDFGLPSLLPSMAIAGLPAIDQLVFNPLLIQSWPTQPQNMY